MSYISQKIHKKVDCKFKSIFFVYSMIGYCMMIPQELWLV